MNPFSLNAPAAPANKPGQHKDSFRELVETVVFVVVLVLMLKLFVIEAFVIPTGSMAETLYGNQKQAVCTQCGFTFPVSASYELEPNPNTGRVEPVIGYHCPNCQYRGQFESTPVSSGDRVLVHKAMKTDDRGHVVVFKYPEEPQKGQIAQNYIKRLMGFGGETIVLFQGNIFFSRELSYPSPSEEGVSWTDHWMRQYMNRNDPAAIDRFRNDLQAELSRPEGFQLYRKPDDLVLEEMRIVNDNDFQPMDLVERKAEPRWKKDGTNWKTDAETQPKIFTHSGGELNWLRYRHLIAVNTPPGGNILEDPRTYSVRDLRFSTSRKAELHQRQCVITNFMGYNGAVVSDNVAERKPEPTFWSRELIVECEADLKSSECEVVLELSQGANRYQAHFQQGEIKLIRTGPGGKELARRPSGMASTGKYHLRFANVDCRLRVWVNGRSIDFGNEADYPPRPIPTEFEAADTRREGWTIANDVEAPASIGIKGDAEVAHLKIYRDTYYTPQSEDAFNVAEQVESYYIQPGHYLCLGDNSTQSSDGRSWGVVPERLMLGRAVFVFWPPKRMGVIR
jgi:signal peptidase I